MRRQSKFSGYAEETSNYIMSVSDLMSGLLFIFIITLIFFVITYKSIHKSLVNRDQVRTEILHKINEQVKERNLNKNLDIEIDQDNGVIHIRDKSKDKTFFESGEAVPVKNGIAVIEGLSDILVDIVPCYTDSNQYCSSPKPPKAEDRKLEAVFIEGHTDRVPVRKNHPKYEDNWDLSTHRAIATYNIMVGKNEVLKDIVNAKKQHVFSVSGYGETRPITSDKVDHNQSRDRRIDLRFIMMPPEVTTDNDVVKEIQKAVSPK